MERKKRWTLIGAALLVLTAAPILPAAAMPFESRVLAVQTDNDITLVRYDRGHHYGWYRGRHHHYGWYRGHRHHQVWSRHRHRVWL
jgi:hypothetical protein